MSDAHRAGSVSRPEGLEDPLPVVVRKYIVALETALAASDARAWTVATELRYEAGNRNDTTFSELADELAPTPPRAANKELPNGR